jgi:class 3 adenylate cyclase/AmiR/NasT family two-component response regulator
MDTIKILIVGNNDIGLQIIKGQLLEFEKDWLIFKTNYHKAGQESNSTKFNLIIIDCNESSNNIEHQIKEIKGSKINHTTPIIVCLQDKTGNDIEQILEAGALDFINKPYKPIELFARVRTGLTLSSTIHKLEFQSRIISERHDKVEKFLYKIIPTEIIQELKDFGKSKPKKYREASVLFADLVDFTRKSRKLSPKILIDELTEIFTEFDNIVNKNKCTRIKTMGDGYLAVSGIPSPNTNHTIHMIKTAIDMREYLMQRNSFHSVKWDVKIGINSGEVIGSILGNNYLFDVFGDAVNEAARMEKFCEPNQINISENTYLLSRHQYNFIERLSMDIKGLGRKKMYYLKSAYNMLNYKEIFNFNPLNNKMATN